MLPITASNPFKWRHYRGDIILWCVRWYLRYPISLVHMAEMAAERGLVISASCIWRWVQVFGPKMDKRCRPHLKRTNRSWRLDETYINIKGRQRFLYRAVNSTGQTIDFLLTDRRDAAAAKRFFRRALRNNGNSTPRVINVGKNPADARALTELKASGTVSQRCRLRQCKYLNNIVEQDHRNVKRRTWLAKGYGSDGDGEIRTSEVDSNGRCVGTGEIREQVVRHRVVPYRSEPFSISCISRNGTKRTWLAKGYGSFQGASRTLECIETMSMIRKGRVRWVAKSDVVAEARFIAMLFAIAP